MFVWILILSPWVALLLMVLHDATKDHRETAVGTSPSSTTEPIQQSELPVAEAPASAPKKKPSRRRAGRVSASIPELELAITEAVRQAAPECEAFVGVTLQQTMPRSRLDVNWQLRGVRFGTANRKMANEALTGIIERMQREFYLAEH